MLSDNCRLVKVYLFGEAGEQLGFIMGKTPPNELFRYQFNTANYMVVELAKEVQHV